MLEDGCPRCEEHAESLYDLDKANLEKLALAAARGMKHPAVTWTESKAIQKLLLYSRIVADSGIAMALRQVSL